MEYTVGFLYSEDRSKVALIRKAKPEWQKGLLNGIGGKKKFGESALEAQIREFEEEAGVRIESWRRFCVLRVRNETKFNESSNGDDWIVVHFFSAKGDLSKLKSMEEEQIEIHNIYEIPFLPTIPNLRWLVPMGIDKDNVAGEIYENHNL